MAIFKSLTICSDIYTKKPDEQVFGKNCGYSLTHEPMIDALDHGRSDYITVNLRAGTSYGIVGVCDRDCRDLDIALYDSRGNLIDSDLQDDDIPVITINPSRSGTYQVRVDMANCKSRLCYYGIGVFGQ